MAAKNQNITYFWKPHGQYGAFSNWSQHSYVDEEGNTMLTSESGLMFAKWKLFDPTNMKLKQQILESTDPAVIKSLGRRVKNFYDNVWDQQKYYIMVDILKLKFSQNQELKTLLLSTGDSILVEASSYDKIWGIGLNESDAKKTEIKNWPGENLLGKALMEVRSFLRV